MDVVALLPQVNAGLNGLSAAFLLAGICAIRARQVTLHRRMMVSALASSALFLVGYLTRVALSGTHTFVGPPLARRAYLLMLSTHMVLAVGMLPFIFRTLYLGLTGRFAAHRRVARWTAPVWMYVSVTGVGVYLALYHLAPRLREVAALAALP